MKQTEKNTYTEEEIEELKKWFESQQLPGELALDKATYIPAGYTGSSAGTGEFVLRKSEDAGMYHPAGTDSGKTRFSIEIGSNGKKQTGRKDDRTDDLSVCLLF